VPAVKRNGGHAMKIWMLTENGAPQHIGFTDGDRPMVDLLSIARERGFCVFYACRLTDGNDVKVLMFDKFKTYGRFRLRNSDCDFTEHAQIAK
jgi:hypothetical protein